MVNGVSGNDYNWSEYKKAVSAGEMTEQEARKLRADKFDDWTNSEDNYNKFLAGEKTDGFKMFDIDLSTYSSDLKDFAQDYIDKFDENGDGKWNKAEFIKMATGNADIPVKNRKEYMALFDQLFDDLNLNDKKYTIDAGEFASFLYASDMDWDGYSKDSSQGIAPYIDGELDWVNYQSFSSLEPGSENYDNLQYQKKEFFDNFYA